MPPHSTRGDETTPAHGTSYAGVELIDDDHLLVFGRWLGRDGCIYRRLPAAAK